MASTRARPPPCTTVSTADHDDVAPLLGARVLGALDPEENDRVRRHLARCARCRSEVEKLEQAVERLPAAPDPPDELWQRIVEEVRRRNGGDGSDE